MSEVIRELICRVGVDLAKRVIQVHAVGCPVRAGAAGQEHDAGEVLCLVRHLARRLHRGQRELQRCAPCGASAAQLLGVGPVTASAVVASVGDFKQFKSAKPFGGWLGLAPSQNSWGGKASLGRITKRGDTYLRTLLIQGAKSAVMTASKRSDAISRWLVQLTERVGWQKAAVALANKNARILWCVMTRGDQFDPNHIPQPPHLKPQAA